MLTAATRAAWSASLVCGLFMTGAAAAKETRQRPTPVQVCLGDDYAMVLDQSGTVWAWGGSNGNSGGQMGLGDDRELNLLDGVNASGGAWHFAAEKVATGYRSIACAERRSAGIRQDASLWAWGEDVVAGPDGRAQKTSRFRPQLVGTGYDKVAVGHDHTLALKSDGTLWAWGGNEYGQLGDGSKESRAAPVLIGAGYRHIAAGRTHSAAIAMDGSLWMWGSNQRGQLGLGEPGKDVPGESLKPVRVMGDMVCVAVGDTYSAAVNKAGELLAWGQSRHGFGSGIEEDHAAAPRKIGVGFEKLAMDHAHTLAIKRNGQLMEWGWRTEGARNLVPIAVGEGFTTIAAGGYASAGIKPDGSLWMWGSDDWQALVEHGYSGIQGKRAWLQEPTRIDFPLTKKDHAAKP